MSNQSDCQASRSQGRLDGSRLGVLVTEGKPPPRIELAKERLLICRLYGQRRLILYVGKAIHNQLGGQN